MAPQIKERTKPCLGFTVEMAISSGTSATHPNHPRLYGGNARISKTLDKRDPRTGSEGRNISAIRNNDISPLVDC